MAGRLVLCELDADNYHEVLALWQQAGLHVRAEGRDAPEAFARQAAGGLQRVAGLRAPGGQLVAVVALTHDGRKGWINRLAVHPEWRRQGLAGRLVAEGERWFKEDLGLEVWAALIEAENAPSRALLQSLGYSEGDVVYVSKRLRANA